MTRIVAMTGLSGVGKTTFLTALRKRMAFQHLQAGSLIRVAREMKETGIVLHDNLRNLDLDENQKLLVEAFHHARDKSALTVMDGHTIIEREEGFSVVPKNVFAALQIDAIFALVDRPEVIATRRAADLSRQRPKLSTAEIKRRQSAALDQAKAIAVDLRIPFRQIMAADEEQCLRFLSSSDWNRRP